MIFQITNFIFFFILTFLVVSCSNKSEENVIISNDDKPKEEKKQINSDLEDSLNFKLEIYNQDSVNLSVTNLESDTNRYFIERFPNLNITKQILISNNNEVQHLEINYKDSFDRKNAFFNYLDCFDKTCRSIKFFDKVKFKKGFFMLVVSQKSIHIIESEKNLDATKWINFVRFSKYYSPLELVVIQKKLQKAKWFYYQNYKLIEIP